MTKKHLTPKKLLEKVSQLIIVVSGVSKNISKVYHNLTMQKVLFKRIKFLLNFKVVRHPSILLYVLELDYLNNLYS